MRLDSLSPRTWLLAGVAGWAVCLWVFALVGLGGRLGKLPDDVEPQRLPATKLPAAERPGPPAQYLAIADRPIFSENRRPQKFVIGGTADEAKANTFDFTLTSVLIAGDTRIAILRPTADGAAPVRVKLNEAVDSAPQWTLAALQPRQATFRGPDGDRVLDLRVFDGVGGDAPPPIASASPPPASGAAGPGGTVGPVPPPPGAAGPQPGVVQVQPPAPPSVPAPGPASAPVSTEAQLEAIRKRIEARRAQLRQQAAQAGQTPGGEPGQTP
ncbi:MAG: general secretion pathway protein GspN [Xanthomonadales bacterium]|nr:general secretion pathway protein GspN [Xanthomonadales bacterium]